MLQGPDPRDATEVASTRCTLVAFRCGAVGRGVSTRNTGHFWLTFEIWQYHQRWKVKSNCQTVGPFFDNPFPNILKRLILL